MAPAGFSGEEVGCPYRLYETLCLGFVENDPLKCETAQIHPATKKYKINPTIDSNHNPAVALLRLVA